MSPEPTCVCAASVVADGTYMSISSYGPTPTARPRFRLGPGQHTQYTPTPLPGFNLTAHSVAAGQDHTLILTKSGEVYSWGLNRFSQLGYVVETVPGTRSDEPIQLTPRKIAGGIKNRRAIGGAACKTASVCWTEDEVFTWGTNNGQLGACAS